MKTFEEIGKALMSLANLLLVLIVIKEYLSSNIDVYTFIYGFIGWFGLFVLGALFIYFSEIIEEYKND